MHAYINVRVSVALTALILFSSELSMETRLAQ